MATELEFVVGTYEQYLLCYKIKKVDDETLTMERIIATHCHHSSIRCMDVNGKYLATGGSDDRIVIIDLKLNKEVQSINMHKSSVNAISFTADGSHFLSGSEDGQLIATKVGSWVKENAWNKPHTGKAIMKICIHESGKVAFTLGKDGTLRSWDMLKGRQINTTNVKDLSETRVIMDNLELCPNGEVFAMSGLKTVTIISVICGKMYDELQLEWQITSMCWIDDQNLLIGMENGSIEWTNIVDAKHQNIPEVHTNRVKGMHYLNGFLATICSSGDLTLWSISISEKKLTQICTINDSCRPTCVKLINTTENRYKGETKIETVELKEPVVEQLTKSTHLQTAAKVIIEIDGNDDNQTDDVITNRKRKITTTSAEKNLEIASTAIPLLESPIKKKKKIRTTSTESDFEIASTDTSMLESPIKTKKKKIRTTSAEKVFEIASTTTPMLMSPIKTKKKKIQTTPADKDLEIESTNTSMLVSSIKRNDNVNEKKQKSRTATKESLKKIAKKKPIVIDSVNSEDDFDMRDWNKKESKIKTLTKESNKKSPMVVRSSKRKGPVNESGSTVTPLKQKLTPTSNKKLKNRSPNVSQTKRDDEFDRLETENKPKKKSTVEKVSQKKQQLSAAGSKSLSVKRLTERVDNNNKRNPKQQQSTAASKKKVDKKLYLNEATTMLTRNKVKWNRALK